MTWQCIDIKTQLRSARNVKSRLESLYAGVIILHRANVEKASAFRQADRDTEDLPKTCGLNIEELVC